MGLAMSIDCLFRTLPGRQKAVEAVVVLMLILLTSLFVVNLGPFSSGFYFTIGMAFSERILDCGPVCKSKSAIVGSGFMVAAVVLRILWFRSGYDFINSGGTILANSSVVAFLSGLWFLSDLFSDGFARVKVVRQFMPLTAFVYFMHYPVNDFIKHHLHGLDIWGSNCCFVILSVFAPLLYLLIAWCSRMGFVRVYSLLSGGR